MQILVNNTKKNIAASLTFENQGITLSFGGIGEDVTCWAWFTKTKRTVFGPRRLTDTEAAAAIMAHSRGQEAFGKWAAERRG